MRNNRHRHKKKKPSNQSKSPYKSIFKDHIQKIREDQRLEGLRRMAAEQSENRD
jgi:hypothetical protein